MTHLPASPDLSHLKKQAKQLLRDARAGEADALHRFVETLPAVRSLGLSALAEHELKLHDAQSVVAREYGFQSWTELKRYVDWKQTDKAERLKTWLTWVYDGTARQRRLAVRMLQEEPAVFAGDAWVACATGDEAPIRNALRHDAGWANRAGGARGMFPLVAVTHSRLILEDGFAPRLLACATLLLDYGADVNGARTDPRWPDWPLSALYGATGQTHHVAMTKLLLDAGANPNDNESLYHSVESRDPNCTKLLLDAGARVVGTNTIGRALDYDRLDVLLLLLQRGGDATERPWIHHAILRGRSLAHIRALIDAGADLRAVNDEGISVFRWAQMHGRTDVVALPCEADIDEPLTEEEQFVAACSRGDEDAARALLAQIPDIVSRLTPKQLQALPQLADIGDLSAVRTMLALGWPLEVKVAWDATALNLAVYRGDAEMTELLFKHGADWRTKHGFDDTVLGTLSYASQDDSIEDPAPRNYIGCARAIVTHGPPLADFERYTFSPDVSEFLDMARLSAR